MEDRTITIRVPTRWIRTVLIVGVTALIVAPLTAVATHSFTDVPDSNTFHADIEWLKDAGVTMGCNPPANTEYCPDDPVTRGQMAAFLRRLAENQDSRFDALEALLEGVTRDGDVLLLEGMNLQVVNGEGVTETTNGLGNIIVGYNEDHQDPAKDRSGSHNLVVGPEHAYRSYSGLVSGRFNSILGPGTSVSGLANAASGLYASVTGGNGNSAPGDSSSVSGGAGNVASGLWSSVSGGNGNRAVSPQTSILGGVSNQAIDVSGCIPSCP